MKVDGNNKSINFINGGEVNQIKSTKLTEITFDCLLPQLTKYPFATYENQFKSAEYYLEKLKKMKLRKTPFEFVIKRSTPSGDKLFSTTLDVTLEKYTITEDIGNGFDIMVSITLKKYIPYGTKKFKEVTDSDGTKAIVTSMSSRASKKTKNKTYTIKKGDCLNVIARKELGSSSKWKSIYTLNKDTIEKAAQKHGRKSSSNGWWIYPGTVLKLPS